MASTSQFDPHHLWQERLQQAVAPLDGRLLNQVVERPDDHSLLDWIRQQLPEVANCQLRLGAGGRQGAIHDFARGRRFWRRDRFEAAHWLPKVAPGHKCGRLHGHGFELTLHSWDDDPAGWELLCQSWEKLRNQIQGTCLNEWPGLENPTSEHLVCWIWSRLELAAGNSPGTLMLLETPGSGAVFDGVDLGIWKERSFDSAILGWRAGAPDSGCAVRSCTGHTFRLRLGLVGPLDPVCGWTQDFGEVAQRFAPLYTQLDHQPLHHTLGVMDQTALLDWIYRQAQEPLPALRELRLWDTPERALGYSDPALPLAQVE